MPQQNHMHHVCNMPYLYSCTHFTHSHCLRRCALSSELHLTFCAAAEMLFIQRRGLSSQRVKTWNIRALPKGMSRFSPSTSESNQASFAKHKTHLEKAAVCNVPVIRSTTTCMYNSPIKNEEANILQGGKEENTNELCDSDIMKRENNAEGDIYPDDDINTVFANNIRRINEMKQHASTSKTIQFVELPPWPVDSVEYNTRADHGGHDKRLAFERQMHLEENITGKLHKGKSNDFDHTHTRNNTHINSSNNNNIVKEQRRRRAIDANKNNYNEETQERQEEWEEQENKEMKFANPRLSLHKNVNSLENNEEEVEEVEEEKEFQHTRVADEIRSQPVGRIINVRNRFNRWTCTSCKEINSLQSTICRRCAGERFHMTLRCTYCNGITQLHNKLVYGDELCDSAHYTMSFGVHNCFARLAPEMKCTHCHKSLHGAAVELDGRRSWWCACGCCSHNIRQSCMRCRLPRSIPLESILLPLLQHRWDFRDSSCWYCEGCDGVNRASRYVVALYSPLARQLMREHQVAVRSKNLETTTNDISTININPNTNVSVNAYPDADLERGFLRSYGVGQDGLRKEARLISGEVSCRHCGLPWHHQLLRSGSHWRCACHALNSAEDTQCKVCDLPALDMLSANVISLWNHGDWYCIRCHRHCYRLRPQCICGARRVALPEDLNLKKL